MLVSILILMYNNIIMKEIIVDKKYDGKKLNKIILEKLPNINYNTFNKLLRKKDIKVNEKRINKDILVYENDKIILYMQDDMENNAFKNIKVVYEDDNILVLDKPVNIEVTGENNTQKV